MQDPWTICNTDLLPYCGNQKQSKGAAYLARLSLLLAHVLSVISLSCWLIHSVSCGRGQSDFKMRKASQAAARVTRMGLTE